MSRREMPDLVDDGDQGSRGRHRPIVSIPMPQGRGGSGSRTQWRSRRTATIAAMTTGTIAVSTAAFAATVPGDHGTLEGNGSVDTASLIGGTTDVSDASFILPLAGQVGVATPTLTGVSITPSASSTRPNAPVLLTVRASQAGDQPMANAAVRIMVANGPKWVTTAMLHTDATGSASITAHLLTTTKITATFDGTGALRPASAAPTTVTIVAPNTSADDSAVTYATVPGSTIGAKVVYLASLQKGKPYVWGAEGPYSFDCSGLVQYVFAQLGRSVPRTAEAQYDASHHVPNSAKQPGDLIFFGAPGSIYHVAIYAGNGYIWQAPQTGETVQLVPIWSSSYLTGRYL